MCNIIKKDESKKRTRDKTLNIKKNGFTFAHLLHLSDLQQQIQYIKEPLSLLLLKKI